MTTSNLDLVLRWLHILGAVTLAGGVIFWRCALLESLSSLPDSARQEFSSAIRSKWSGLVMVASGLLLVTGLVNFMFLVQQFELDKTVFAGSKYHMLFGIKFLLALAVFLLSALLAGRTPLAEQLRSKARFWLNVNTCLVIAIVCLGGLMKAAPRHPKPAQSLRQEPLIDRAAASDQVVLHGARASK